jgi:hypothetical protein
MMGALARDWDQNHFVTTTTTLSANNYGASYTVAPAAYVTGMRFCVITNFAVTGSATINVNSLGAKTIKRDVAGTLTALASGDLASGQYIELSYNGTDMIWTNAGSFAAASTAAQGIVELATDGETQTGTDTARAITPSNLTAKEATVANYRANTADRILTTDIVWSAVDRVALTWTSAGTTAVDMSLGLNFTVTTATGNSTLGAPTNAKTGQSGFIEITQDAATPRTLAFNAAWVFAGGTDPALTATISAKDILYYTVLNTTGPIVHGNLIKAVA